MALFQKISHLIMRFALSNESYARKLGVKIGNNCRIYTHHFGSEPFLIEIGDWVTVSSDVLFINHDGSTWLMRDEKGRRQCFRKIVIGNHVFIGARSIVLPGVHIEDHVVVGAGSIVTKSVPSNSVVAGNPAKIICRFDELEEKLLRIMPAQSELPDRDDYRKFVEAALHEQMKPPL